MTIEGKPVPKGSRVTHRLPNGKIVNREASKRWPSWSRSALEQIEAQFDGVTLQPPYRLTADFFFAAPQKPTYPRSGDLDKYLRAVGDLLQMKAGAASVITDDRGILEIGSAKRYGDPERVEIVVEEIDAL